MGERATTAETLRAEVVSIGDELTTGQRLDTNSQWISRELGVLGVPVAFHTTITDSLDDGIATFRIAAERAEIIVVTGGLGPTADDLTRDVLARVAGVPLELSAAALADVEARFARRAVPCPESNRRQALFPRGSRIIANPEGTAPGIDLDLRRTSSAGGARVFALPGVPGEMRTMWQATVGPAILAMLPGAGTIRFRRIKCFGAGESAIEAMLPDLVRRGREPLVGITAHEATITLRIAARGRDAADCERSIAPTEAVIRECLGGIVYGTEDDEVEDAALAALARIPRWHRWPASARKARRRGLGQPGAAQPLKPPQERRGSETLCRKTRGSAIFPVAAGLIHPETESWSDNDFCGVGVFIFTPLDRGRFRQPHPARRSSAMTERQPVA